MSAFQEQEAKKKEIKLDKPAVKTESSEGAQNGNKCPKCGAVNSEEALFCSECGYGMNHPLFCPNCGAETTPGGDICQACGTWLLENQCKFCYTKLAPGAEFCPECGNPKEGIICKSCGKLSIFDFCLSCGKPVTEEAVKAIENAKNDPEVKAVVDSFNEVAELEVQLSKLEEQIKDEHVPEDEPEIAPKPERKSLFSERQISSIKKTGQNIDMEIQRRADEEKKREEEEARRKEKEEERRKAEEDARRREAQALKEALERKKETARMAAIAVAKSHASKRFFTHQEARRWHNAHRPPGATGWLCNYSGTVHYDGPDGCADPSQGGCFVF